jgi:hypothetical protein
MRTCALPPLVKFQRHSFALFHSVYSVATRTWRLVLVEDSVASVLADVTQALCIGGFRRYYLQLRYTECYALSSLLQ